MAVEDASHGVGDRLVHVVAVDEHGVQRGDRTGRRRARALQQLREHREDGRRVAARRGRLADRQADLALGHREARDRVHHQHHVAALVAEVLRDRGRRERGLQAHQRGLVGRGHDDHRARQALGPEVALHELENLSTALADQADHVDLGRRRPGDHAQQRRLTDAGAGEDAEALAAPAGHQRIQGAHAQRDALVDPGAGQRIGRRGLGRAPLRLRDRAEPVQRTAQTIESTPQQGIGNIDLQRLPGGDHLRARADARSRHRAPSAACGRRGSRRPPRGPTDGRGRRRSCTPRRPTPRGRWPRRSDRSGRRHGRCGDAGPLRGSRPRPHRPCRRYRRRRALSPSPRTSEVLSAPTRGS